MRIEKLPRKEFKRVYGTEFLGEHFMEEGEHIIVVPEGASTKTRLHEIAHAELGHEGPAKTYGERVKRELEADSWVYEKLGRTPSETELIGDFAGYIDELLEKGYSVVEVFNWLKKAVEDAGYVIDREFKSNIWWLIRGRERKRKESK